MTRRPLQNGARNPRGADKKANFQFASNLLNQIRKILAQSIFGFRSSKLNVTIDRAKASILCITMPRLNLDNLKRV